VSAGIGAAIVYFAPANQQTLTATVSESGGERAASVRLGNGVVVEQWLEELKVARALNRLGCHLSNPAAQ